MGTNTIDGIRESYARVCVELDLSQPLEISVAIGKYDYLIEYEHIHLICFSCGRVGHRKESCNLLPVPEKSDVAAMTVEGAAKPDPKSIKYNGTIVSEEPNELGFAEWMLVARKNNFKNRPNGLAANTNQREPNIKNSPNSNAKVQERMEGPSKPEPGRNKEPISGKPMNNSSTANKRKWAINPGDHKFEFNPLLKQHTQAQLEKPIFKPISNIVIDLNTSSSTDVHLTDIHPIHSVIETLPFSSNPSSHKIPPDIQALPTQTYHEYARSANNKDQFIQSENPPRHRDKSNSPSRSRMVDIGSTRSTATDSSHGQRRKFCDNINYCNLVDIGSTGPKFTWSNGRLGATNVQK